MAAWQEWLEKSDARIRLVAPDSDEAALAEVMLTWNPPAGLIVSLPRLKGVISLGHGVDHLLQDRDFPANLIVVRLVDPYMCEAMAEWVLLALLQQHRDASAYMAAESRREWINLAPKIAGEHTVAVMGLGAIGVQVAQLVARFGFRVLGWSRSQKAIENITSLTGEDGFGQCLAEADYVVSVLPLTSSTRDIYSADAFARMKQGCYFINCGRGLQVDEDALLAAVDSGQLSGAALDVFRVEPLPRDHPFWSHPRIQVWPHIAAQTHPGQTAGQVADAIAAIHAGKPPANRVDRAQGY